VTVEESRRVKEPCDARHQPTQYLIVIERAEDGGYGAWAPDLPGCVALGDTIEDAERELREAIAFHLEGPREQGEPVPEPTAVAAVMLTTPAA
jgi:predicted RNase H-like HicB family nuclease